MISNFCSSQECLNDYMPKTFDFEKIAVVIPSYSEFREQKINQYIEKSNCNPNLYPEWFESKKQYIRLTKKIKKTILQMEANLKIISRSDKADLNKFDFDYFVELLWLQYHHPIGCTFVSVMCYQFIGIRGSKNYRPMFGEDDEIGQECGGKIKGKFEYFVFRNGR